MQNPDFKLHPSVFYCLSLGLLLPTSAGIVMLLPMVAWQRAILLIALSVYSIHIFWRFALLKAKSSVIKLKQLDAGRWQVATHSGFFDAVLRGDSTVTTLISILRFDVVGRRRPASCIIFRDSFQLDDYRRLVSIIRMGS